MSAEQVGILFEMCEFCLSMIASQHSKAEGPPEAYCAVLSIQNMLDGCNNLGRHKCSTLERSGQQGKAFQVQEFLRIMEGVRILTPKQQKEDAV